MTKTYRLVAVLVLLISLGSSQININATEMSLKNLTNTFINEAPQIAEKIKNVSLNSSVISLMNRSHEFLNNLTIIDDQLQPEIKLENGFTDSYMDLTGYHFDCTFILNNTGNADGIAVINFEKDNGRFIKRASFLVPANTARKFNEKVTLAPLEVLPDIISLNDTKVTFYIESQRKSTIPKIPDYLDLGIHKN
jgi:hypothetical protein